MLRRPRPGVPYRRNSRVAAVFGVAVYAAILVALALTGRLPAVWAASYLPVAVLLFAVYAYDKAAAGRGLRRVPERLLHALALANGWPDAWLAQVVLRHKTRKPRFLRVFRLTALLNVMAVAGWAVRIAG